MLPPKKLAFLASPFSSQLSSASAKYIGLDYEARTILSIVT